MELNCKKCSKGTKEYQGCERDSTVGDYWIFGGYELARCPLALMTNEGMEYFEAYADYKAGHLPVGKGIHDQTNTFVQAVRLIENETAKIDQANKRARKRQ